jgi:adenylate cyclase
VAEASHAVFLSYASQDAEAAQRVCDALRSAGIEVWFDQSELRGGDAWDRKIRQQIQDCRLFIAVISAHTEARDEGYFRREWKLAIDRTHDMAEDKAFIVPVAIDGTSERSARVPDSFKHVQWTRLPNGEAPPAFVERVRRLLSPDTPPARAPIPSGSTSAPTSPVSLRQAWWSTAGVWGAGAMLTVALTYFVADRVWLSKRSASAATTTVNAGPQPATTTDKSIAVLPFVDLSEKHDQEYFADGLSEQILNLLASIPNLKVIGRSSSFQFKGHNEDLRSIGEKLGAAYVLEGSVRRAGDRVRVTAQLINARDGVQIWSNTYERPFGDVLKLQDELAAGVARALELTVRSDTLHARGSRNSEAYDFYLRGLYSHEGYNGEAFKTAANYFQQALDLDPDFADAAAELGRMSLFEAEFGYAPAAPTYERARRMLETAIRLDPTSGTAHAWLGYIHMSYRWDWGSATAEMLEALRLAPREPIVQFSAARLAMALGHWDQAIGLLTAASARDPLFAALYNSLSEIYLRTDRLPDAEAAERRVLELSPTYSSAPYNLAKVLLAQGRPADALALITSRQQNTSDRPTALAVIYHALGRKVDSDAQLAVLVRQYQNDQALQIADVFAFRGEADEAFHWIDRANRQRDDGLYLIKVDPLLKNIEADPRYKAFLRKMNLPE